MGGRRDGGVDASDVCYIRQIIGHETAKTQISTKIGASALRGFLLKLITVTSAIMSVDQIRHNSSDFSFQDIQPIQFQFQRGIDY